MRYGEVILRSVVSGAMAASVLLVGGATTLGQGSPVPGCEDRPGRIDWDGGGGGGAWNEPTNWVGDALPGPGSHACVGLVGASVVIDAGTAALASLQVVPGASLTINGTAVLELDGPEPSTLATLGLYSGTLTGGGTRTITDSAVLDAGTLTGNGRTVIAPGAQAQVGSGAGGTLVINGGHVLAIAAGATGLWGPGPHDIRSTPRRASRTRASWTSPTTAPSRGSGTLANTGTLRKLSHGTDHPPTCCSTTTAGSPSTRASSMPRAATAACRATAPSRSRHAPGCVSATAPSTLGASAAIGGPGELEVTTGATLTVPASPPPTTSPRPTSRVAPSTSRATAAWPPWGSTRAPSRAPARAPSRAPRCSTRAPSRATAGRSSRPAPRPRWAAVRAAPWSSTAATCWPSRRVPRGLWGPGPHDIRSTPRRASRTRASSTSPTTAPSRGSGTLANTGTLRKLSHGTTTLRPAARQRRPAGRRRGRHRRRGRRRRPVERRRRLGRGALPAASPRRHHRRSAPAPPSAARASWR